MHECPCLFFSHSVRVSLHPLFFGHALVSVLLAGSLALALGGLGGLLSGKVTLVASGHGVELSASKAIIYYKRRGIGRYPIFSKTPYLSSKSIQ